MFYSHWPSISKVILFLFIFLLWTAYPIRATTTDYFNEEGYELLGIQEDTKVYIVINTDAGAQAITLCSKPNEEIRVTKRDLHERYHAAEKVIQSALSDFRRTANKLPYFEAVNEKFYKNQHENSVSREISSLLDNKNFGEISAKFARIYIDCLNDPKSKDIEILFQSYLNGNDYFAERLRLDVEKERNLISRDSYQARVSELLNRYSKQISLSDTDDDPETIINLVRMTCHELADVEEKLSIYQQIKVEIKEVILPTAILLISMLTVLITYKKFELDKRQDTRAEKEAAKDEELIVKISDDDLRKFG